MPAAEGRANTFGRMFAGAAHAGFRAEFCWRDTSGFVTSLSTKLARQLILEITVPGLVWEGIDSVIVFMELQCGAFWRSIKLLYGKLKAMGWTELHDVQLRRTLGPWTIKCIHSTSSCLGFWAVFENVLWWERHVTVVNQEAVLGTPSAINEAASFRDAIVTDYVPSIANRLQGPWSNL
eukprot:3447951-Amphidinium_carterae.1